MSREATSPGRRRVLRLGLGLAAATATAPLSCLAIGDDRRRRGTGISAIVVGAGIAGLAAAYELQKRGVRVTVLEASSYAGGRMVERRQGPLYGPTHASGFFASNRQMIDLADELGIRGSMEGTEITLTADNGVGQYPFSLRFSADEAARIPGMPATARRALPKLAADIVERFRDVDPSLPLVDAARDRISVGQFVRDSVGEEAARPILDYAIGAVVEAWGVPADEASCVPFFSLFAQDGGHYISPHDGIAALPRALERRLDVRVGTPVVNVSAPDTAGRRRVTYLDHERQLQTVLPDLVVCALPGSHVATIIDALPAEATEAYRKLEFAKYAKVSFVLAARDAPERVAGGFNIPAHPDPVQREIEMWAAVPSHAGQPPIVAASLSPRAIPRWQASGKSLPDFIFPFLAKVYPPLAAAPIEDVVVNAGDYVPRMRVGFASRAHALMRAQESTRSRLYFVGEAVSSAHVGGACASAIRVTRAIATHWLNGRGG